jgi:hypothetical protein
VKPTVATAGAAKSPRQTSIEASATALGRTWAAGCRHELHREGRTASGGWPGTLSEARARVGRRLVVEASGGRSELHITDAEREVAARLAYSSARAEWLRHVEPEAP